jgi:hypothetical protein
LAEELLWLRLLLPLPAPPPLPLLELDELLLLKLILPPALLEDELLWLEE